MLMSAGGRDLAETSHSPGRQGRASTEVGKRLEVELVLGRWRLCIAWIPDAGRRRVPAGDENRAVSLEA